MSTTNEREFRFAPGHRLGGLRVSRRSTADGGSTATITGYGAVFFNENDPGTEYQLYPGLRERILPGAFDRVISERQDVRGLFNHEPDNLLGRTSAGTMRLSVDRLGLKYEIDLPDNGIGADVAEMVRRGDLSESSFSFDVISQRFVSNVGGDDVRELLDVNVFDCGPVAFAAYGSTSVGLRALERTRAIHREARSGRRQLSLADMRARLAEVEQDDARRQRLSRAEAELREVQAFGHPLDDDLRRFLKRSSSGFAF